MSDENTNQGASGNASQTDMEKIVLNNVEVEVPKTAAEILKEKERNMDRGFQDKISKERENMKKALEEDTAWYAKHPTDLWGSYEPKVYGGKGFIGDESLLTSVKTETQQQKETKPTNSFSDDAKVKQLERELAEQKAILESIQSSDLKRGEMQVIQDRDDLLARYPYADKKTVTESLKLFYSSNNRHPLKGEIEQIVKEKNDVVFSKVTQAKQEILNKQNATPTVTGTSPLSKKDKLPDINDFEAWGKLAKEDGINIY